jgi:hypothetical protein
MSELYRCLIFESYEFRRFYSKPIVGRQITFSMPLAAGYIESDYAVKPGRSVFGNLFNHLDNGSFAVMQMQPNMLHTRLA